jgi:hypothetical protein
VVTRMAGRSTLRLRNSTGRSKPFIFGSL